MRVTTQPELSVSEKTELRDFVLAALRSSDMTARYPFTPYRLSLYVDDSCLLLVGGIWQKDSTILYLARASSLDSVTTPEKLAILLALSQLCESSEELTTAASSAIARYLLGEYKDLSGSLIQSEVEPRGIAFSTDNRVASLIGSEWMSASGETVDVSGPEWIVCAADVPTVDAPAASGEFRVGQRVHFTPSESGGHEGDGVIRIVYGGNSGGFNVTMDSGSNYYAVASELTPLDTPGTLTVGQRVICDGDDGTEEGTAVIVAIIGGVYTIRMISSGREWHALERNLTPAPTFTIGQRVRYNGPNHADGSGVIDAVEEEGRYRILLDDSCRVYSIEAELTPII